MKTLLIGLYILTQYVFASTSLDLRKKVTVSGISSGGYFAHQFHIINSNFVNGAAIFAAGPFFCARGNALIAMQTCMEGKLVAGTSIFSYQYINALQYSGLIDSAANLLDDRVYLFSGKLDEVVHQSVTNELKDLYHLLGIKDLTYVNNLQAAHTYPTINKGIDCTVSDLPFIGSCHYNGALESLKALYPNKEIKHVNAPGRLERINQREYFDLYDVGLYSPLLMDEGYLYIPEFCQTNKCDLHVSFHGCKQSLDDIGMDYIDKTGITQAADMLGIVVLFPQAKRSLSDFQNPNACWDWWGYSGANYLLRTGQQVRIITKMVEELLSN